MKVTVSLGKFETSQKIEIEMTSSECSVRELMSKIRRRLPREITTIVGMSESSGSKLFLALSPDGPVMLDEQKCLSDYDLTDGCTLWLMCSHYEDEN